jgi:hypothetical protein
MSPLTTPRDHKVNHAQRKRSATLQAMAKVTHPLLLWILLFSLQRCGANLDSAFSGQPESALRGSQRKLQLASIVALELMDANTDKKIVNLSNELVVDVSSIPGMSRPSFNINAVVSGPIQSVVFGFNANPTFRTETSALYAFCGNDGSDFPACTVLGYGTHNVSATPFTSVNGTRTPGTKVTYRITFVRTTKAPTPAPIASPVQMPIKAPTSQPTKAPTKGPTKAPAKSPTKAPVSLTRAPTKAPIAPPMKPPTKGPTKAPTKLPTKAPVSLTRAPSKVPVKSPTKGPTNAPTKLPTKAPVYLTRVPTNAPVTPPTKTPTKTPVRVPTKAPLAPSEGITAFELIYTGRLPHVSVMNLAIGAVNVIDLAALGLPSAQFNINAVRTGSVVNSVQFSNGQRETSLPYAYCSNNGPEYYTCPDLAVGPIITISVTPFSLPQQQGTPFSSLSTTLKIVQGNATVPRSTTAPARTTAAPTKSPVARATAAPTKSPVAPPVTTPVSQPKPAANESCAIPRVSRYEDS